MAPSRISETIRLQVLEAKKNDPTLSTRKLGVMFGLHGTTVGHILNEAKAAPVIPYSKTESAIEAAAEPIEEEAPEGNWQYGKEWLYNGDTETYIINLKCRPRPLIIGASKMQAMKRAYSNWDKQPATINEICRRFSIPRDQFMEMKSTLGWSHDQEPFTAEQLMSRTAEDLATDALQQKRQVVFEEFQKKEWQQIRSDADKWGKLEQSFILPLREHVEMFAPTYTVPLFNIRPSRNRFAVVANTGELHYGKAGWVSETGEEYSREIAEQRMISARQHMLQEVADRGRPEKFFWAIGNDQLHIDNELGTTTKGTPQDCDGTAARLLREGFEILVKDADTLLSVAPLHIKYVPGNHDHLLTYAMLNMLAAWYRDDKNVTVELSAKSRDYSVYGNTLLGFAHGDGALKPKDYMATMAKEAHQWWSQTRHRAFFTGHLHTEVVRELIGGTHYQMKSLSGQDRYHHKNAFLSEAGMCSYVVDAERGVTGSILWRA